MSTLAFRCRNTKQQIDSLIEVDTAGRPRLPVIGFRLRCPFCEERHVWLITEAQLAETPTPPLPGGENLTQLLADLCRRLDQAFT